MTHLRHEIRTRPQKDDNEEEQDPDRILPPIQHRPHRRARLRRRSRSRGARVRARTITSGFRHGEFYGLLTAQALGVDVGMGMRIRRRRRRNGVHLDRTGFALTVFACYWRMRWWLVCRLWSCEIDAGRPARGQCFANGHSSGGRDDMAFKWRNRLRLSTPAYSDGAIFWNTR